MSTTVTIFTWVLGWSSSYVCAVHRATFLALYVSAHPRESVYLEVCEYLWGLHVRLWQCTCTVHFQCRRHHEKMLLVLLRVFTPVVVWRQRQQIRGLMGHGYPSESLFMSQARADDPSTWDVDRGRLQIQDHSQLCSKLRASLGLTITIN